MKCVEMSTYVLDWPNVLFEYLDHCDSLPSKLSYELTCERAAPVSKTWLLPERGSPLASCVVCKSELIVASSHVEDSILRRFSS